ncbi:MAG TPA: glycine cleavage system protein GcvH [Thermoanaerobaculia bacterium]|nr:glycine cleavage system protein GcvH [Thermoanaerobaculia bacterium]
MTASGVYPRDFLYHSGHEWVAVTGDVCTVGITEFAQSELEEIVFVELPEVGARLGAGDVIGSVESIKAVAELYTPIGGEVLEVNEELKSWPAFLNEDPHGKGWMIKLRPSRQEDLDRLMSADAYERHIRPES